MGNRYGQKYFYKVGDKYETYTFIKFFKKDHKWLVRCSCGRVKRQTIGDILKSKKCQRYWLHDKFVGTTVGKLKILKYVYKKRIVNFYECLCDCGNICIKSKSKIYESKRCSRCSRQNRPKKTNFGVAAFRTYFRIYITRTKREKIIFKLNQNQFYYLTQKPCYYCGVSRSHEMKVLGADSFFFVGIDRVDNRIGYIPSNVVPCCHSCNRSKGAVSYDMASKILVNTYQLLKMDIRHLAHIKRTIVYAIKYGANCRKINFLLKDDRVLYIMRNNCYFCKSIDTKKINKKKYVLNGIDRLDNSKGYTIKNSVSSCFKCNNMKKNITVNQCKKMLEFKQNNPYYIEIKALSKKTEPLEHLPDYKVN